MGKWKSINERWLENLPRDWKSLTPQQKLEVTKKLVEYENTVRSTRAGTVVEDEWKQYLTREFKYVFKRPVMKSAGTTVEADYIVGNDLKRLRLIESKRTPFTGWSKAERTSYPQIKRWGGYFEKEFATNLVDGQAVRVGGQRAYVGPNEVNFLFPSDQAAVASGQKTLDQVLETSNWYQRPRPKGSDLYVALDRGTTTNGLEAEAGGLMKAAERRGPSLARRLGIQQALDVGTEQAARLALRTFRGLRSLSAFAFRMVIPPLTPASIVIELVLFALTELVMRYFEKVERENFQEQLERLPPRVEKMIKANREAAAAALIASVDSGGPGFVYARITATVSRTVMDVTIEKWDVQIDRLDWDQWYSNALAKPPVETNRRWAMLAAIPVQVREKKTTVVFDVSEPIFTPFDWLLGAFQWLRETLLVVYEEQTGVPGGVGPTPPNVDKKFLQGYYEIRDWLTKMSKVLEQHRAAEELVGTEQIGPVRRSMIADAARL